jgi:phosphopantetheinyl transferase
MYAAALETIDPLPDGTDVWIVRMGEGDGVSVDMLPRSEDRERYDQIVPPRRKRQFIFRRVALDYVLRHYVDDYTIERDANGKPYVGQAAGKLALYFSSSSSSGLCAVGVSRQPVGVDLEVRSQQVDINAICERYVPAFAGMSEVWKNSRIARQLALCAWCRTESYVKLHGLTLHAVLFKSGQGGDHASSEDVVISGTDFVCVVSQHTHQGLKNIHHIGFEQAKRIDAT